MIRRFAYLLAAACALLAGFTAPAQSDDASPSQVLPDMQQQLPSDVKVALVNGEWRLGFTSDVYNAGPGYLKITGNGPGDGPMVADQIVQMSDGSSATVPGVGELH